ncbi:MAG: hypothetical protein Athens041674_897 [Parcubacteria group bacterium Athens0416_74]|nr:MAG: hypothetical protein Athens041674_897 [Parcubacteria group bacterium Athens0416_74]
MNKSIWAFAVLVLIAGGVYFFLPRAADNGMEPGGADTPEVTTLKQYKNDTYGMTFAYRDSYVLSEVAADGTGGHLAMITLMDKVAAANIPEGGEGPVSITFDIYKPTSAEKSAQEWIRSTPQSNFQLSADKNIAEVSVAGTTGYAYTWDGLYRGRSIAFAHGEYIVVASVTMLEPTDMIVSDFDALVQTLEVQ